MVTPENPKVRHKQRVIPKEFLLKRLNVGYDEIQECFNRLKKPSNPRQMLRTMDIIMKLKTDIANILNKVPKRGITTKAEQELVCNAVQSVSSRAKEDISALIKSSDKVASGIQNVMRRKISEVLSKIRTEINEKFEIKDTENGVASTTDNTAVLKVEAGETLIEVDQTPLPVIAQEVSDGTEYDEDEPQEIINKTALLSQHFEIVVFSYFKHVLEKIFKQIKSKINTEKKQFYPKFIPVSSNEYYVLYNFAEKISSELKDLIQEKNSHYFKEEEKRWKIVDSDLIKEDINAVIQKEAASLCEELEELELEMKPAFIKRIIEGAILELDDVICAVNNNVLPDEQENAFDTMEIILNGLIYSQIPADEQKDTLQWLEQREIDETERDFIKEKLVVLKITNGKICPEKIIEITDYINEQMYCGLPIRNSDQIQRYITGLSEFVDENTENDIEILAITTNTGPKPEAELETAPEPESAVEKETAPVTVLESETEAEPKPELEPKPEPGPAPAPESIPVKPVPINETKTPEATDDKLNPDIEVQINQILAWFESLPDPIHKKLYWKMADFLYAQLKYNSKVLPSAYVILYLKRFQLLKKHYTPKLNSFKVPDKKIEQLFEIPASIPIEQVDIDSTIKPKMEEQKLVEEIGIRLANFSVSADKIINIQNSLVRIQEQLEFLTTSNKELSKNLISSKTTLDETEKKLSELKTEIQTIAASDDFDSDLLKQKIDEAQDYKARKLMLEIQILDFQQTIKKNEQDLELLMEELKKYQKEIESEAGYSNKRPEVIKRLKAVLDILKK